MKGKHDKGGRKGKRNDCRAIGWGRSRKRLGHIRSESESRRQGDGGGTSGREGIRECQKKIRPTSKERGETRPVKLRHLKRITAARTAKKEARAKKAIRTVTSETINSTRSHMDTSETTSPDRLHAFENQQNAHQDARRSTKMKLDSPSRPPPPPRGCR